jgi:hypothetical protein
MKEANLAPLYKGFTAMGSEGRTVTGSMIMKIAVFF